MREGESVDGERVKAGIDECRNVGITNWKAQFNNSRKNGLEGKK